jgi:hypothetical protein
MLKVSSHFRKARRLNLQGGRIRQETNQEEAGSKHSCLLFAICFWTRSFLIVSQEEGDKFPIPYLYYIKISYSLTDSSFTKQHT